MGAYPNENDITKEFIRRTRENYENYQGKYEVTNWINSMLGLVVIPKEDDRLYPKIENDWIGKQFWDEIRKGVSKEDDDLCEIVRHLRNAIAHGGIKLLAGGNPGEIREVEFEDKDVYGSGDEYKIKWKIDTLKKFVEEFAEAAERNL